MTEDQNDRCYQYAAAVGVSETNPAMKQLHSEHPWNHNLPAVRTDLSRTAEISAPDHYLFSLLRLLSQNELSKVPVVERLWPSCHSD